MNKPDKEVEARLLVMLQKGLPITARPFAVIGGEVGLSEAVVLERVKDLFASGIARRFGAVFESRKLGYLSTLCAADVPVEDLAAAAARIAPHPGITHCYEREGHPNLWFTMTALAEGLEKELEQVAVSLGPYEILNLPALQKFKIEAVFGQAAPERTHPLPLQGGEQDRERTHPNSLAPLRGGEPNTSLDPLLGGAGVGSVPSRKIPSSEGLGVGSSSRSNSLDPLLGGAGVGSSPLSPPSLPPLLSELEKQVVRRLQGNIEVSADPFSHIATDLKIEPAELLALLTRWEAAGVIRRIGLILRHRQLGFSANSMCVWKVPADRIKAAGTILAQSQHVTHCYERPASATFPYNLYAMIHAKSRDEAIGIFEQLGADTGLSDGRMLWSVREFKKSSPVFFGESVRGAA